MKVILFGKKMRLLMIELKQTREDPYSLWHCLNKKVEMSAEKNAFTARRKCEVIQKTTNYKSRRMRPTVPGNRQGDSDFHGFQKEPTLTNTLLSNFALSTLALKLPASNTARESVSWSRLIHSPLL